MARLSDEEIRALMPRDVANACRRGPLRTVVMVENDSMFLACGHVIDVRKDRGVSKKARCPKCPSAIRSRRVVVMLRRDPPKEAA